MPNRHDVFIGRRLPDVYLGEMRNGEIESINAQEVLGRGRVLAVGAPGAFTPVCSSEHVPGLVANHDKLKRSGISDLVCIVAGDPFVTDVWRRSVDPLGRVRFVSDGNLDFARAMGLLERETSLFMGDRSQRYLLLVQDGVIASLRVEASMLDLSCTRSDEFVLEGT
jgi:peroxiredoxin